MSGQLVTLLIVGTVIVGGWCFLAGPCKGKVPEIDKIAQAAQDAINQLIQAGENPNLWQPILNSGTSATGIANAPLAQDPSVDKIVLPAGVKPGIASHDAAAVAIRQASTLDAVTKKGGCTPGAGFHFDSSLGFVDSCNKPASSAKGSYARANLGEISHFRMSIG